MMQPAQPQSARHTVTIVCFVCDKEAELQLKPWELEREIICPTCHKKEAVILSII